MPYEGEVIAKITTPRGDLELRKLTIVERAASGRDLFCLVGASHWNPADFFTNLAEDHEILATAFRDCEQFFDNTCPECGRREDEERDELAPECRFCAGRCVCGHQSKQHRRNGACMGIVGGRKDAGAAAWVGGTLCECNEFRHPESGDIEPGSD